MTSVCNQEILLAAADSVRSIFLNGSETLHQGELVFAEYVVPDLISTCYAGLLAAAGQETAAAQIEDILNEIIRLTPHRPLLDVLEDEFFEMLVRRKLDVSYWLKPASLQYEQLEFLRQNFLIAAAGIAELRKYCGNPLVNPAIKGCLGGSSVLDSAPERIAEIALLRDPFAVSRTFRYVNNQFTVCDVKPIPVEKFFGFHGVREQFRNHLEDFAANRSNVPLLVSSLPGLGKTQFSIAYSLLPANVTLIFAEPETLNGNLEALIGDLALRLRRKFVVFFDDIEPDNIDWYGFRTNVGGSARLPENITFILASNYHFPINILSRGREITFPVFDEIRCLEMVEDFLRDFGMKSVNENLASVIAAGYIEDFGQKKFTELSPRTLMRYLDKFRRDSQLRRKMMEQSKQEMIVRPDSQLFYEFNIKLLRLLYGESYIDAMREEKLRELGA